MWIIAPAGRDDCETAHIKVVRLHRSLGGNLGRQRLLSSGKTLHLEQLTGNNQRDIDRSYALPPFQPSMSGHGELK
jgi:hypothetical protein